MTHEASLQKLLSTYLLYQYVLRRTFVIKCYGTTNKLKRCKLLSSKTLLTYKALKKGTFEPFILLIIYIYNGGAKGHTFTFRVAKKGLFFKIKAAAVGLYNLHLAKIPLFSVNEHIRKKMYGSWALSNVLKRARKKRAL